MDEIISLNQIDEVNLETTEENETPMNINEEIVIFSGGGSIDFEEYPVDSGFVWYNEETGMYSTKEVDVSGKVDKPSTSTNQQVVTVKPNGETEGVGLASNSSLATFGAIPRYQNPAYDDADTPPQNMGNLVVADPTKPLHVVNKRFAEDNFVSKTDEALKIYGTDSQGNQVAWTFRNTNNTKNTVAGRDSNGNIQVSETPINDTDATAKKYVDDKFNGANKAVSFVNYSSMITSLNALGNTSYSVGQNIMIVTLAVPELWVSEVAETSVAYTYVSDDDFVNQLTTNGSVQVGYYKLSALEIQKVDLTEYVKNTDYGANGKAGVVDVRAFFGLTTDQWG